MKKIALLLICLLPAFIVNAQRGINPRDRASLTVHYATQKAQHAPELASIPLAKVLLKNTDWYLKAKNDLRTKGQASIGGFTVSPGGSGGSWSSSSSGFSGGGGSSGGGGASGSW